jgi:hypothetical protein
VEGRIEIIFLRDFPAGDLVCLGLSGAVKQPLRDRIHEFIGVGERFVLVIANEVVE